MGRKKTIERDAILDAAEAVAAEQGVSRLTLEAVAQRAGISKGGLAYSFASKDDLVAALIQRDIAQFTAEAERHAARYPDDPYPSVLGHVDATRLEDERSRAKAIGLLLALVQNPERLAPLREAYGGELGRLDRSTPAGRRARVAFFAAEGAFLLRGLGLLDLPAESWDTLLDDVRDFYLGKL